MYVPRHFDEPRIDVLHELIRAQPLATLVILSSDGLNANHIPLHLAVGNSPFGTLRGHVARANSLWSDYVKDVEALAIFSGPDTYISPSWYPSKAATGKAVPTWNYAVAHAYGQLRVIDDASWLRTHLEELTAHNEAAMPEPWRVADAPADYIEKMLAAVVGIEMDIVRLTGKWKMSQNQPPQNQAGVVEGLLAANTKCGLEIAAIIEDACAHQKMAG